MCNKTKTKWLVETTKGVGYAHLSGAERAKYIFDEWDRVCKNYRTRAGGTKSQIREDIKMLREVGHIPLFIYVRRGDNYKSFKLDNSGIKFN